MAHMLQVYAKNPSIHVHYFLGPFNTRKRNTFQQVSNVKTWFLVCLDTTFKCQKEKVICRGPLHGWISDHQLRLCHTWRPLAATNIEICLLSDHFWIEVSLSSFEGGSGLILIQVKPGWFQTGHERIWWYRCNRNV